MEENRVRLARIRSPKQNDVRIFNLAIRASATTGSENRRQTGDARGMSSPVAAINIVGAHDAANEFLRGVIQFVDSLGTTKHAKVPRIFFRNGFSKSRGYAVHRFVPGRRTMYAIFAHQRLRQTRFRWLRHGTPKVDMQRDCSIRRRDGCGVCEPARPHIATRRWMSKLLVVSGIGPQRRWSTIPRYFQLELRRGNS
jgi:hypothetical protein